MERLDACWFIVLDLQARGGGFRFGICFERSQQVLERRRRRLCLRKALGLAAAPSLGRLCTPRAISELIAKVEKTLTPLSPPAVYLLSLSLCTETRAAHARRASGARARPPPGRPGGWLPLWLWEV